MNRTATALMPFLAAAFFAALPARAEADYEFADKLLRAQAQDASFSTADLVERLAARLDDSPATKTEATFIRAALKRQQANDATPEKKVNFLKEASELYKEAAGDKKFRLAETAARDSEMVQGELIGALIEISKGKPEAGKYRAEAAAMFGKKAADFKAEADAAKPKFDAAFEIYKKKVAELNPKGDENKVPGPEVMVPLEKGYDAWIIADKKYVAYSLEQVEKMDEADANRKKLAADLIDHCKKMQEDETNMQFAAVTSRYAYLQGRFFAAIGSEDEAKKAWKEALDVPVDTLSDAEKREIISIRKHIIHDLVKLMVKAKKYNEVEELFITIKTTMRDLLQEDAGKELIVDYGRAVAANAETAGDYEKGLKEVYGYMKKEAFGSQWANTFARAMADMLLDARGKKVRPSLTAEEWYAAARGFHLMGRYYYLQYEKLAKSTDLKEKAEAEKKFEEAYKEFNNGVDYYRRAIAVARQADRTDLATRLDIEPKAWFEMGLSYMRMKHDYEAIIAYKAMKDSFSPEYRAKWMPDPKAPANARLYTKGVQAALKSLDAPARNEGMLAKSGINILIALDENEKVHKDAWNAQLKSKIIGYFKDPLDPDAVSDKEYVLADGDAKAARVSVENAKKATTAENAETLWNQAFKQFTSAAAKFAKVKPNPDPTKSAYDYALVQIANNLTQAQQIVADGRGPNKTTKAAEVQSKDLALKALAAYQAYEDFEAKNPTQDEKILDRRKKFRSSILLAKNSLFTSSGNWAEAVKSADAFLAWESENPPPGGKSAAPVALLNKFRAQLALAAGAVAPASDPHLKGALATLTEMREVAKNDTKLNTYMLSALSERYNIAAFQLEHLKKTTSDMPKEQQEKFDDMINEYELKVAELQGERVDLLEDSAALPLDDYSRLVYLFHRTGQIQKAADIAERMLKKFDPANKNMTIPDTEAVWKPFLDGMLRAIKYDAIDKDTRCKQEHTTLIDFMYDTDQGAQLPENDRRRPKGDLYNEDMEKALAKLISIRNPKGEFADVQTLKAGPQGDKRPYLLIVEEEIQFRRKIVAARDLLSDMALEVADKLKKEGKDDLSNKYLEMAKAQIEILKALRGESVLIEIKVAEIDLTLGKVQEAVTRLQNAVAIVPPDSMAAFIANRRLSEIYAMQGKWGDAVKFPEFMAVTQGFNNRFVRERWPGMLEFLKNAYKNGAKMPEALRKKIEASDAPKGDAPKSDTPAAEAPKAEEAKKVEEVKKN